MSRATRQFRPRDARLVELLAAGRSRRDAAAEAGCSERTVSRRLSDPAFVQAVQETRSEAIARAAGRLAALADAAVAGLSRVLEAGSDSSTVAAARCVFDSLLRIRDATEIENRIARLEELAREKPSPPRRP